MKRHHILAIGFLTVIFVFGIISDVNLIRHYASHEVINEEWTPELGRKNETEYAQVFSGKDELVDLNGGMRNVLGQREMNGVVRLKNGQLTEMGREPVKKKKLRREAANVAALSDYLKQQGIPFLYVMPPDKIMPMDDEEKAALFPEGFDDDINDEIDIFLDSLSAWDVSYIDLRQNLLKDKDSWYDRFYKTDHHWTSQAGFEAYQSIARWIKDNTDIPIDERAADIENYDLEDYKNCLLGSWGQRTGSLFSGADDITLFVPKYETDVENLTFNKRGTMDTAVYNREYIHENSPDFIFDAVFDSTDQFVNYSSENDTTIMIITDSYGRVVNPFLILSGRNMWYQSSYRSSEINEKQIQKLEPDIVIMLQSPRNNLGVDSSYQFDIPGVKN